MPGIDVVSVVKNRPVQVRPWRLATNPSHVRDRSLAHAAAQVDVGRVRAGSDPAGVDGDGERVAMTAVHEGGPAVRRAVTDPPPGDLYRGEPCARWPGWRSGLVTATGSRATRLPPAPIRISRRLPGCQRPLKSLLSVLMAWPAPFAVSGVNHSPGRPGTERSTPCDEPGVRPNKAARTVRW